MKTGKIIVGATAGIAALIGLSGFYTVDERHQAIVSQFGVPVTIVVGSDVAGQADPERIADVSVAVRQYEESHGLPLDSIEVVGGPGILSTGLRYHTPLLQGVRTFDDRKLIYSSEPEAVGTRDKRQLVVDTYATWRIEDPLLFSLTVQDVNGGMRALDDIIYSALRVEMGKYNLHEVVRTNNNTVYSIEGELKLPTVTYGRESIFNDVVNRVNNGLTTPDGQSITGANNYGIEVVDVRIILSELPESNEQAVYQRMISERGRIASLYRSQGEAEKAALTAKANREYTQITSGAYALAEETRGEGDAEAARIYADAYGENPEFFRFIRTLEAYKEAFANGNTTVVMPSDTEFNQFLLGFPEGQSE
ncbi:protease modulator HflC [Candidatus Woesearchaeota archaeon]|nr:protease modulator HflC [Candidatus Woesearchaeota archaeon]